MEIKALNTLKKGDIITDDNTFEKFLPIDENGREINIYKLSDVQVAKDTLFYPNTVIFSNHDKIFYNPIEERIMSLDSLKQEKKNLKLNNGLYIEKRPVFFFNYNTDNYYHFIYDTLPYLISYNILKNRIKGLKLLMNYPNSQSKDFYNFNYEFLELLGINKDDIIIINDCTYYSELYISSSYTHGVDSNTPPRNEIYTLYKVLFENVKKHYIGSDVFNKKLYISRRTWLHNDFSNIGTNYTTRRRMRNEEEVVNYLVNKGYSEIFTEKLTTIEKIWLFGNATHIVGAIGGGICNVLFSKAECQLIALVSPTFLDVNKRFIHSLNKVDLRLFGDVKHVEDGEYKKYMRVKYDNIIGEIIEIKNDQITIKYTKEKVAGWNNQMSYHQITVNKNECVALDKGLNSEWELNLNHLSNLISI